MDGIITPFAVRPAEKRHRRNCCEKDDVACGPYAGAGYGILPGRML